LHEHFWKSLIFLRKYEDLCKQAFGTSPPIGGPITSKAGILYASNTVGTNALNQMSCPLKQTETTRYMLTLTCDTGDGRYLTERFQIMGPCHFLRANERMNHDLFAQWNMVPKILSVRPMVSLAYAVKLPMSS
jgi:hypothetical protein